VSTNCTYKCFESQAAPVVLTPPKEAGHGGFPLAPILGGLAGVGSLGAAIGLGGGGGSDNAVPSVPMSDAAFTLPTLLTLGFVFLLRRYRVWN
jgi:hypothetical protein